MMLFLLFVNINGHSDCAWLLPDHARLGWTLLLYTAYSLGHCPRRLRRRRTAPLPPIHGSDVSHPLFTPPRFTQQAIAFLVSFATHTVLLPLEIFTVAFVLLCLVSWSPPASPLEPSDRLRSWEKLHLHELTPRPSDPRGRT